ncbi:DUF481 domain-containing protein [Phyllobacterium lublinensis]|uniref:DUF481 domain-containing protein n=1 Tax=Phyllobacterium lublinensis TaxID=2875708 RepID=UPI001CC96FA9|nr:DUF481 domain-containing protein [Phyllobacterium sp. 2063]MBZ9654568.1 DUF481 domain-containing protein [Phyllobacterium sp. 2063]
MKSFITLASALTAGLLLAGPVAAADITSPMAPELQQVEKDGWTFAVSPYFWAAGMSGDTGLFGLPTVHTDMDFGELLNELDFAAMAIGEARYDRYSIFSDIMYSKISSGSGTPRGIIADHVGVTSETFTGLIGAGYSVLKNDRGNLDVVAGARLWYASTEISFSGGILDGVDRTDSATWVDGLAGVRAKYSITDKVYFTGWGLVGAGGADLDWDLAGGIGYNFNDKISAVAGYRALGVDYSNDGFVLDIVQQGPIFGVVMHF